ncbi:hypothetical protein AB0H34_39120 [Saccharopolyspora shandongensis]|uniref:effector-associated constant component EACC1 n=1 Tax=Saccharopolyspora shandongensis TaxID=418495 RepID=UPI0033C39B38
MRSVSVQVGVADGDAEELDRLTRRLREDLLQLDVDRVAIPSEPSPEGSKGTGDLLGTLLVTVANSAVLVSVCQLVRAWVMHNKNRRVVLKDGERTLELTATSAEQHEQIISAFLRGSSDGEVESAGRREELR